jgi:C4-dicarboxylate-binding protein DctP
VSVSRKLREAALAGVASAAVLSLVQSAAAESFTLRIGSGHPSGPAVYVSLIENYFVPEVKRRVEEETEHSITFVEGYGGAIAGVSETLESVQNGILDIGGYCFCFEPSKLFLHNFPYYAPFGPEDSEAGMQAVRAVYDEVPWLSEVFETDYNQVLLGLSAWDNYHLGTKQAWQSVAELQGVKIGGAGPNLPWLEYAGAVPVQTTLPDVYLALQTGVFSGILLFPSSYLGFKFYEPAPYFTLIGFGAMPVNGLTMNKDSLERLPPEVQAIIKEVGRGYEERTGPELNQRQAAGLDGLEKAGAEIKKLPAETRAEWAKSLAEFPREQAKEADGRGMPGTETLNAYLRAAAEVGHNWPHPYALD